MTPGILSIENSADGGIANKTTKQRSPPISDANLLSLVCHQTWASPVGNGTAQAPADSLQPPLSGSLPFNQQKLKAILLGAKELYSFERGRGGGKWRPQSSIHKGSLAFDNARCRHCFREGMTKVILSVQINIAYILNLKIVKNCRSPNFVRLRIGKQLKQKIAKYYSYMSCWFVKVVSRWIKTPPLCTYFILEERLRGILLHQQGSSELPRSALRRTGFYSVKYQFALLLQTEFTLNIV